MRWNFLSGLLVCAALAFQAAPAQTPGFGHVYAEFECGGEGANDLDTNLPEKEHAWWIANSQGTNGTPYTLAGWQAYRAADASQQWTYEFDLPDDAQTAVVRLLAHQALKLSISGPDGVNDADRQAFTGTTVYEQSGLSFAPVSVDVSSALVNNPTKKIYLRFEAVGGTGVVLFHLRLDDGNPSFTPAGGEQQYGDEWAISATNGSASSGLGWRAVDQSQYVIYQLDLLDSWTQAWATVDVQNQYRVSVGLDPAGPWTEVGSSTVNSGGSQTNRAKVVANLTSYLTGNAEKKVYLLIQDSVSADYDGAFWRAVTVSPTDPQGDPTAEQTYTFGTTWYEFEAGGSSVNDNPYLNIAEWEHVWWSANSAASGGTPYTADGWNVYRAADGAQTWTYEFNLPDGAATPALRLLAHQDTKVSLTDAAGVSAADKSVFNNGVDILTSTGLNRTPVTVELAPYLTGNSAKKFYLKFTNAASAGALLFHARVDTGWPAFTCHGGATRHYGDDELFLNNSTGSFANAEFRTVNGAQQVTYELDLPNGATTAWALVNAAYEYKLSVATADPVNGPWTVVADSATLGASRKSTAVDLTTALSGNTQKRVYLRLEDSAPATSNADPAVITEGKGGVLYTVALSATEPSTQPPSAASHWTLY